MNLLQRMGQQITEEKNTSASRQPRACFLPLIDAAACGEKPLHVLLQCCSILDE